MEGAPPNVVNLPMSKGNRGTEGRRGRRRRERGKSRRKRRKRRGRRRGRREVGEIEAERERERVRGQWLCGCLEGISGDRRECGEERLCGRVEGISGDRKERESRGEVGGGVVTRLLFVCMEGVSGNSKGGFGDEGTRERWGEGGRGEIVVGRDRERGMVHGLLILCLLCLHVRLLRRW